MERNKCIDSDAAELRYFRRFLLPHGTEYTIWPVTDWLENKLCFYLFWIIDDRYFSQRQNVIPLELSKADESYLRNPFLSILSAPIWCVLVLSMLQSVLLTEIVCMFRSLQTIIEITLKKVN